MILLNLIYVLKSVITKLEILHELKDLLLKKLESKDYCRYNLKEEYEVVILTLATENLVIKFSNNFGDFYCKVELIKYINKDLLQVTKEILDFCTKHWISKDSKKILIYNDSESINDTNLNILIESLKISNQKDLKMFESIVSTENDLGKGLSYAIARVWYPVKDTHLLFIESKLSSDRKDICFLIYKNGIYYFTKINIKELDLSNNIKLKIKKCKDIYDYSLKNYEFVSQFFNCLDIKLLYEDVYVKTCTLSTIIVDNKYFNLSAEDYKYFTVKLSQDLLILKARRYQYIYRFCDTTDLIFQNENFEIKQWNSTRNVIFRAKYNPIIKYKTIEKELYNEFLEIFAWLKQYKERNFFEKQTTLFSFLIEEKISIMLLKRILNRSGTALNILLTHFCININVLSLEELILFAKYENEKDELVRSIVCKNLLENLDLVRKIIHIICSYERGVCLLIKACLILELQNIINDDFDYNISLIDKLKLMRKSNVKTKYFNIIDFFEEFLDEKILIFLVMLKHEIVLSFSAIVDENYLRLVYNSIAIRKYIEKYGSKSIVGIHEQIKLSLEEKTK